MLACLGHRTFVTSYDQNSEVETSSTHEHRLHKAFVSGNIDDADFVTVVEFQPRET